MPGGKDWGTEPETEKGLLHTEIDGVEVRENIDSEQGNYDDYYSAIYEAIRNGQPLPVTAEEGKNVIRIIQAAFKSSEAGKVISL
jgi:predicted dehydrogenase